MEKDINKKKVYYSKRVFKAFNSTNGLQLCRTEFYPLTEKPHRREVYLIMIFLILMPLIFSVNSLARIDSPDLYFSQLSQEQRVEGNYDLKKLPYKENFEELKISWNGAFVSKCTLSPNLGYATRIYMTLYPYNQSLIGDTLKSSYSIPSDYIFGPKINYSYYNKVELDKFVPSHFLVVQKRRKKKKSG